jgi:hypothetical protein
MSEILGSRFPMQPNVNDLLDIETVLATPEKVVMRVKVDHKVHQPFGILHGGVSALLAEGRTGPDRGRHRTQLLAPALDVERHPHRHRDPDPQGSYGARVGH